MNLSPHTRFGRAGLAVLTLGCSCAFAQGATVLPAEVEAQARHIAALDKLVASLRERQAHTAIRGEKLKRMREQTARLNEQVADMRSEVAAIEADLDSIAGEYSHYRSEYRKWVRIEAVGEEFSTLVAANGKTYRDVVVRRVTDVGLEIMHATGPTRLRHDQLPAEFRDRFQWDPDEAAALLTQEAASQRERARLIALAEARAKERRDEAARETSEERIAKLERQLAAVQSSVSTSRLDSSGSLGESRPVGSGSIRSRYYRYYGRSRPTIYYYNTGRTPSHVTPTRARTPHPALRHPVPSSTRTVPRPAPTPPMRPCPGGMD